MSKNPKHSEDRNSQLIDAWSFVHLIVSGVIALIIGPFLAVLITFAWEPIENFVLSPILGKFGILFGHETLKNSLADLVFNSIGIGLAYLLTKVL